MVSVSREDYHNKIKAVLSEPVDMKLKKGPTSTMERRASSPIKMADIPDDTVKRVIPHASVAPRVYGLPNIHMEETPLRPIVNCIASPTQNLARYLAGILSPFVGQSEHHIKNSETFLQKIQSIVLKDTDTMVCIDVVALFTSVPLEDTLQIFSQKFHRETVDLMKQVLTKTYFLYDGSFFPSGGRNGHRIPPDAGSGKLLHGTL